MSTYHVTASRDDGWWVLTVEGPGLRRTQYTQVKRLEQAEAMARDLIALMLDIEGSEVGAITVALDDNEVSEEVADTHKVRREAERLRNEAARATRHAARDLYQRGYVQRDIGYLLGVSHQAVGKLLTEGSPLPQSDASLAGGPGRR